MRLFRFGKASSRPRVRVRPRPSVPPFPSRLLKQVSIAAAILAALPLASVPMDAAVRVVYDRFSSDELSREKWATEDQLDRNLAAFGKYHIAREHPREGKHHLIPLWQFQVGETLEYTIQLVRGAGNHVMFTAFGSGNGWDAPCSAPDASCDAVGYWNGRTTTGDQPGTYQRLLTFHSDRVVVTTRRPDGKMVRQTAAGPGAVPPCTVKIVVQTGDDGTAYFTLDDFIITMGGAGNSDGSPNEERRSWGAVKAMYR